MALELKRRGDLSVGFSASGEMMTRVFLAASGALALAMTVYSPSSDLRTISMMPCLEILIGSLTKRLLSSILMTFFPALTRTGFSISLGKLVHAK